MGLAVAAIAVGLAALALGHDIRSWDRALERGDAAFATDPAAARWTASTWLPHGVARRLLGLDDDLALRRSEQAFAATRVPPGGFSSDETTARRQADAELALGDVIATGSPSQTSRAGNLLGILAVPDGSASNPAADEARAAAIFDAAIRADPANADPAYNLELLLRRIRVVGTRDGSGNGAGDLGDALAGAGSGSPGSGY